MSDDELFSSAQDIHTSCKEAKLLGQLELVNGDSRYFLARQEVGSQSMMSVSDSFSKTSPNAIPWEEAVAQIPLKIVSDLALDIPDKLSTLQSIFREAVELL